MVRVLQVYQGSRESVSGVKLRNVYAEINRSFHKLVLLSSCAESGS